MHTVSVTVIILWKGKKKVGCFLFGCFLWGEKRREKKSNGHTHTKLKYRKQQYYYNKEKSNFPISFIYNDIIKQLLLLNIKTENKIYMVKMLSSLTLSMSSEQYMSHNVLGKVFHSICPYGVLLQFWLFIPANLKSKTKSQNNFG